MRQAQVYRWQLPMDAGVVLRERRLKPRWFASAPARRRARRLGKFSPAGIQPWKRWMRRRRCCWRGQAPGAMARGRRCRPARQRLRRELRVGGTVRRAAAELRIIARRRSVPATRTSWVRQASLMPGEKGPMVKVGLYGRRCATAWWSIYCWRRFPDLTLRLDANRAWTPLKAAAVR